MDNNGKVFLALLGGLAAGAILGILFAPDEGSKTRQKIADTTTDFTNDVKEKVAKVKDKFKSRVESEINEYTS